MQFDLVHRIAWAVFTACACSGVLCNAPIPVRYVALCFFACFAATFYLLS